jgi:hypothetical protein
LMVAFTDRMVLRFNFKEGEPREKCWRLRRLSGKTVERHAM